MKVSDLSPKVTPYKMGSTLEVDFFFTNDDCWVEEDGYRENIRRVYFQNTPILEFGDFGTNGAEWLCAPLSVANGSAEVRDAMNLLMEKNDCPCRAIIQDGKAIVVNIHNGNEIALPY